jgi:crotonobetainyl-CoA:carnitine CoA-transferase CaiB-like acyl-CoA transferase
VPASDEAPLDGVRVLEFAPLLPGPYAGLALADLGASVVKVEPPGGDPARAIPPFVEADGDRVGALFCALNRGKRSVELDLTADEGDPVQAYHRLARGSDVVLDAYGAGTAADLGVGHAALADACEDLVYVDLTGHGPDAGSGLDPGHDLTYAAWQGALDTDDPRTPPVPTADATGALWAAALAAAHLPADGVERVDASLAGSLASATVLRDATHLGGLDADPLARAPGYGVFACADGEPLAVGALEPRFWRALAEAIERPALLDVEDPILPDDAEALRARLAERFRQRPRAAWLEVLREAGVPCAPARSTRQALDDPVPAAADDPPRARKEGDLLGAPALGEADAELLGDEAAGSQRGT